MDVNPHLNIEIKKDSPAKLAEAAGKPTEYYLFAPEFNAVVRRLNFLRDLISFTQTDIDAIIARGVKVDLGDINIDFLDFINTSAGIGLGDQGVTYITFTNGGISYVFGFTGEPGIYGDGLLEINDFDVELLFDSSVATSSEVLEYCAEIYQFDQNAPGVNKLFIDNITSESGQIRSVAFSRQNAGTYRFIITSNYQIDYNKVLCDFSNSHFLYASSGSGSDDGINFETTIYFSAMNSEGVAVDGTTNDFDTPRQPVNFTVKIFP